MVRLNLFQTKALTRLFKKVDFNTISFEDSIEDGVIIRCIDTSGWEAVIDLDQYGKMISFLKTDTKLVKIEGLTDNES